MIIIVKFQLKSNFYNKIIKNLSKYKKIFMKKNNNKIVEGNSKAKMLEII